MPSPGSRKRLPGPERREQLIAVARSAFAELGYEPATVEELAHRAGVSKPVLYEHFGGKEALFRAVVEREMDFVLGAVSAAIETGSPRERLERGILAFLTYARDHPDGFTVLSHDAPASVSPHGISSLMEEVARRAGAVFGEMLAASGVDPATAPIHAHATVGMATFVGQWWVEERTPPVEEVARELATLCWAGLRGLPTGAEGSGDVGPDASADPAGPAR